MASENTPLTEVASSLLTKENAQAASSFAKEKFQELRKQTSDGDFSIRLFALVGGILMMMLSATEFLGKVLTLRFFSALLAIYTFVLGAVALILEGRGQIPFFPGNWTDVIMKYALILRYVSGRGALYFVAGTLQLSQMGLLDLICGGFMTMVGVVYIIVGKRAQAKLRELKDQKIPAEVLKARFQQAASEKSGKLDLQSFKTLALSLGLDFNRRELETAFMIVDKDGDGMIEFSEFESWWFAVETPSAMFDLV